MRKTRVYVAGPFSKGDQLAHVSKAIYVGNQLREAGYVPFIPHLTALWHLLYQREYDDWLAYDREFLQICDCVFRIAGESKGADAEKALAESLGMPVYYHLHTLLFEQPTERE